MRYSPSREPGTCMLCHSIYLQVKKVHGFEFSLSRVSYVRSSRTIDESLHYFVLPSENQNAFARSADLEFQLILYSRIETARHLVRSDFLQRSTQNFEILRRVPRVKNNNNLTKFKKNTHTHTHISLSLSTCRSADAMFTLMCLHQSLSLSLSLYICKLGLDPDQTRMVFWIECFINLRKCACDRKYSKR